MGAIIGMATNGPIVAVWYLAVRLVGLCRHDRILWPYYSTNVLNRQVCLLEGSVSFIQEMEKA
jgi:hypothetical protein